MPIKGVLTVSILIMLTLSGCTQVLFQKSEPLPNKIWEVGHNVTFNVDVIDTTTGYDFYIDLRNDAMYPYSNIYMFVNTTFPSGKGARDTVECILADGAGRWLGSGLGDILDNHILFKQNIRFPNAGTYTFSFEQGMRKDELPSILDLGISIEKHTGN